MRVLTLPPEIDAVARRAAEAMAASRRLLDERESLLTIGHELSSRSMLLVRDLLLEGKQFVRIASAVQPPDERRN